MEDITSLTSLPIPYSKEITFQNVCYENGFNMLRLRIREGKRFTMIDLDHDSVNKVMAVLAEWQKQHSMDE